jgi:hypothetical protein
MAARAGPAKMAAVGSKALRSIGSFRKRRFHDRSTDRGPRRRRRNLGNVGPKGEKEAQRQDVIRRDFARTTRARLSRRLRALKLISCVSRPIALEILTSLFRPFDSSRTMTGRGSLALPLRASPRPADSLTFQPDRLPE